MRITNNTTLAELYTRNIIEKDLYRTYEDMDFVNVGDVLMYAASHPTYYYNSFLFTTEYIQNFISFLKGITNFIFLYEKDKENLNENVIGFLPDSLMKTIHGLFQKDEQSLDAKNILSIILEDNTEHLYTHFIYTLIVNPVILFDDINIKNKLQKQYLAWECRMKATRYKRVMAKIILGIIISLKYNRESVFYKRLIDDSTKTLGLNNYGIKKKEIYVYSEFSKEKKLDVRSILKSNNYISRPDYNSKKINEKLKELIVSPNKNIEVNLQKKYEELQSDLSVRTRNVLRSNLPAYKDIIPYIDKPHKFLSLKNCGAKTIIELKSLLNAFIPYFISQKSDEAEKSNSKKELSELLEQGAKDIELDEKKFNCFIALYPKWEDFTKDLTDIDGIYEKLRKKYPLQAYDILNWLIKLFDNIYKLTEGKEECLSINDICSSSINIIQKLIQDNKVELEYNAHISEEKDMVLKTIFNNMVEECSNKCKNIIEYNQINYRDFINYVGKECDLLKINNVGKKSAMELTQLLQRFYPEYERILLGNEELVLEKNIRLNFPFLKDNEVIHVQDFTKSYHHFPMFYILCQYLKTTDIRYEVILALYFGLRNDAPSTIKNLSESFSLSKERIRQVLRNIGAKRSKVFNKLTQEQLWEPYNLKKRDYFTPDDSDFLKMCAAENVNLSFYSYCLILNMLEDMIVLTLSKDGKAFYGGDLEEYDSDKLQFISYAYNSKYKDFKFVPALNEARRLIRMRKDVDIKIPLYTYFITNPEYWTEGLEPKNDEFFHSLLDFFEHIIVEIYGDCIEKHNLILEANSINYSDAIYTIIKDSGGSMHINEIIENLKIGYPDCKFEDANQIRPYLLKDSRVKSIGKSSIYTLAEWDDYTGSLFSLAIDLVTNNENPVLISELSGIMLKYRPDSNRKSTQSVIRQCVNDGKLVLFYGEKVGIPDRTYKEEYIVMPRTFDEWMAAFANFVKRNQCFPCCSNSKGFEMSLYHWYYETKSYVGLSSEEILKFYNLMKELDEIPHNKREKDFLDNCVFYKEYALHVGRILTPEDDKKLYSWFVLNAKKFLTYKDNRCRYFKDLINFLQENIMNI
jgi:hypothetical protein